MFISRHLLLFAPARWLNWFATLTHPLTLLHVVPARATLYAFGTGVLAAFTLFLLLLAVRRLPLTRQNRWSRPVRLIADGTFTIYLMHYPLMVLLVFLRLLRAGHPVANFAWIALVCVTLTAMAAPMDGFKRTLQRWLRTGLPGSSPSVPTMPLAPPPASRKA